MVGSDVRGNTNGLRAPRRAVLGDAQILQVFTLHARAFLQRRKNKFAVRLPFPVVARVRCAIGAFLPGKIRFVIISPYQLDLLSVPAAVRMKVSTNGPIV